MLNEWTARKEGNNMLGQLVLFKSNDKSNEKEKKKKV
jgi:hypothetical protein